MTFKDHFSGHAGAYAAARPTYPPALFDWIASVCEGRWLAWDVGCGNGQAALALAERFDRVIATDPSAAQIAEAIPRTNVEYRVERAEASTLAAGSADLVTVAQALHWLELDAFFGEVRRVLAPTGVLAVWCYGLSTVSPPVDAVFTDLYTDTLGTYWPPERRHIEAGYRTLPFPFTAIEPVPPFEMRCDWTLAQYLAYLRSWSASQRYLAETGRDAIADLEPRFAAAWGDPAEPRPVRWPLAVRAGRMR
jgi:ubiquinone/menaquinone biosynthesis C-methylase UbiE